MGNVNGNLEVNYKIGDTVLGTTIKEKDIGVTISKFTGMKAASKSNQMLGFIRITITYKERELIIPLYKAIVWPLLEYIIVRRI